MKNIEAYASVIDWIDGHCDECDELNEDCICND